MLRFGRIGPLAVLACTLACSKSTPPADANGLPAPAAKSLNEGEAGASLYKRLGGYDALAAVTDSFLVRLHSDTAIMAFFAGIEKPGMDHIRQMVVDQLCAATGGPCIYPGKSMKDAHAQLEITSADFDRFAGHFQATLVAFKVPSREQNEVMGALASMKGDIVRK
jgi:hemoglobin